MAHSFVLQLHLMESVPENDHWFVVTLMQAFVNIDRKTKPKSHSQIPMLEVWE